MGHNTLAVIPRSKYWKDVVLLLRDGADAEDVVRASARAAEKDILDAASDPVFVEAVRILLNIPLAARDENFGKALRDIGLAVGDRPELLDLIAASTARLDAARLDARKRSDIGELSGRALARTLSISIGDALPGLFGASPEDVQIVARKLSWSKGISELTREYFGNLISGTLSYWLDRTLALQVGEGLRFENAAARSAFDGELAHFAVEGTRIIQEFSSGWYGTTLHREGGFGSREAAAFGAVAVKKIVAELQLRDGIRA